MTAPEYQGQDLPLPVQRAIARLMDPALPIPLSASERMALAALLRRVEARDGSREFWVRRCNLAATFDCVERTITNWLAALERKGLIVKEQGRTRWGNFKSLTLQLSEAAITLLGLDGRNENELSTAVGKKTSFGHNKGVYQEQSLSERHSASPDRSSKPTKTGNGVPADCAPLLDAGLSAPAIFKLMSIATRHGKRLGDLVQARGKQISAADNPFALACSLASDGIDYAAMSTAVQVHEEREASEEAHRTAIADAKERFVGCELELDTGRKASVQRGYVEVFSWDGSAWLRAGCLAGEGLVRFWDHLVEGRLRPATAFRPQGEAAPSASHPPPTPRSVATILAKLKSLAGDGSGDYVRSA